MHELSIAQRMVETLLQTAARSGGGRVASARLLLGELTCVEPETLTFAFDVSCRGTAAEGCRLEIVRVPVRLRCPACGAEGEGDPYQPCAGCGGAGFDVLAGREIRLDTMELDEGTT